MMMEQEQKSQLKMARAQAELMQMKYKRGKATKQELEAALEQVEKWKEQLANPVKVVVEQKPKGEYVSDKAWQNSLSPEIKLLIDQLEAERSAVDNQKKGLSTALAEIPSEVSAKETVEDILFMRGKWQALTDKIKYVYQFGKLPEAPIESIFDEHDFAKVLPNNKYELDKEIKNIKINLYKYRQRLQTGKTEVRKQHYQTLIAQSELKLGVMQAKFNHL
jgi:hypothetical protein